MSKKIAILGASGSVGTQALDVARARGLSVDLITANSNEEMAERYAREFKVKYLAMGSEASAAAMRIRLADTSVRIFAGEEGICEAIAESSAEVFVNSILGEAGLKPSLAVIGRGSRLALANKESLVIAGDIVMSRARERGVEIIPVDSEHCAIYQSLKCGKPSEVKRLILTASGGPFFGRKREELRSVTLADTLAHPTWKMGRKITVDSATLMNKGFEIIEAAHLFAVPSEKIRVVVHRESILHSAVEYIDNSVIGEFSVPDMRMCVQYAVDYPDRCESTSAELDLAAIGKMTFSEVDTNAFPLIDLAKEAISKGGAMGAVLNAADEVAVGAFLEEKIGFTDIYDTVESVFNRMSDARSVSDLEGIIAADRAARAFAKDFIKENLI